LLIYKINFHGSDVKALHQHLPRHLLPIDYDGDGESLEEMNENWIKHLKSKEPYLKSLASHGIDKSKIINSTSTKNTDATNGVIGTFRKLNID
jgi:hypothetical protein